MSPSQNQPQNDLPPIHQSANTFSSKNHPLSMTGRQSSPSSQLTLEQKSELAQIARKIVAPGKGILAADESTGTIGKRFSSISVENNESNRRAYRDLLFAASNRCIDCLGGVILFDETIRQSSEFHPGVPFVKLLSDQGIVPGIKVDKGLVQFPSHTEDSYTQGLDGLAERCKEYYVMGARFAKWRAIFKVNSPQSVINWNAINLAMYAAICQTEGLVPIVEPELLIDGDHSIEACAKQTELILSTLYREMYDLGVFLEGSLLKVNMVTSGKECPKQASPQEIAVATVTTLSRTVPVAVPGVVFLSGGQSEREATDNLLAINQFVLKSRQERAINYPWALSFSYGRALQHSVLDQWKGRKENVHKAQDAFVQRAKANGHATQGIVSTEQGDSVQTRGSLFVSDYRY